MTLISDGFPFIHFVHPTEALAFSCMNCKRVSFDTYVHISCGRLYCKNCCSQEYCDLCGEKFTGSIILLKDWNLGMYQSCHLLEIKCASFGYGLTGGCSWSGALGQLQQHLVTKHGMLQRLETVSGSQRGASEDCKKSGNEIIPCKYAEAGCTFTGNTSEKEEHEKDSNEYHLRIVWDYVQKLKAGTAETHEKPYAETQWEDCV